METNRPNITGEASLFIARPPEYIWEFLLDLANDKKWRTGVIDARLTSTTPVGLGTTGVHIAVLMGAFPWTLTEWEERRVAGWDFTSGILEGSHGSYRIEPERVGSRVLIRANIRLSGFFGILMPLMRLIVPRLFAGDLRKLKAIMEA
jgi:hypothetical protein